MAVCSRTRELMVVAQIYEFCDGCKKFSTLVVVITTAFNSHRDTEDIMSLIVIR